MEQIIHNGEWLSFNSCNGSYIHLSEYEESALVVEVGENAGNFTGAGYTGGGATRAWVALGSTL